VANISGFLKKRYVVRDKKNGLQKVIRKLGIMYMFTILSMMLFINIHLYTLNIFRLLSSIITQKHKKNFLIKINIRNEQPILFRVINSVNTL
jgi:hypothetical protein